jgi:hypothetical protein
MGINRDIREGFLSEHFALINENDNIAEINSNGKILSPVDEQSEIDNIIQLSDKWTNDTFKLQKNTTEKIENILLSDLIDDSNVRNKNNNSEKFDTPQINYDISNGVLSFTDESVGKYNQFGCLYEGTDNVKLFNIVKDLEVISQFNRLTDFGAIYDFQVKKITYGAYQLSNTRICTNLAKVLGFFSLDKVMNDEQIRQFNAEKFGNKYTGILENLEYVNSGWIDIDTLIKQSLEDEYGYNPESSIGINTKKFKDRKKALIYLIMNYACDIWSLNSTNKLVDFGIRIIDKTTDNVLDYNLLSNGTNGETSYSTTLQYFGDLPNPAPPLVQPDSLSNLCDKVYTNKCNGLHFRLSDTNASSEESLDGSLFHEITPQFKINMLKEVRENKKDILNTIDAIHWTTGINTLEEFSKSNSIEMDFIDDIVKEFGRTPFLSSYLVQDRAFHNAGGSFTEGFSSSGLYHTLDPDSGNYGYGGRDSTEEWNSTTWSLIDSTAPIFGMGLSGGNAALALAGWGAKVKFAPTDPQNYLPPIPWVYADSIIPDKNVYTYNRQSGWSISKLNTVIHKFACAGTVVSNDIKNKPEEPEEPKVNDIRDIELPSPFVIKSKSATTPRKTGLVKVASKLVSSIKKRIKKFF